MWTRPVPKRNLLRPCFYLRLYFSLSALLITFPGDRAQSISFLLRSPFQSLSLAYHIPAEVVILSSVL